MVKLAAAAAMKTTNFPVKGNNNKTELHTCVCVSEYLFMCMCKKPSPPTPPQRQHKGECNTKIALKAGAETTTKKKNYAQKFDNKK